MIIDLTAAQIQTLRYVLAGEIDYQQNHLSEMDDEIDIEACEYLIETLDDIVFTLSKVVV